MNKKYKSIVAGSRQELDDLVNKYLSNSGELVGGLHILQTEHGNFFYSQAMLIFPETK